MKNNDSTGQQAKSLTKKTSSVAKSTKKELQQTRPIEQTEPADIRINAITK